MKNNRFDHLEPRKGSTLPAALQTALSRIERFDHLEIGDLEMKGGQEVDRVLCTHCGQYNEKVRTHCWACYRWVGEKVPPPTPRPDLELILDGKSYRSADEDLPEDVRILMGWIQRDGYSTKLLSKWRQWRATRNQAMYRAKSEDTPPFPTKKMMFRYFVANGSPSFRLTGNDIHRWIRIFHQRSKLCSIIWQNTRSPPS